MNKAPPEEDYYYVIKGWDKSSLQLLEVDTGLAKGEPEAAASRGKGLSRGGHIKGLESVWAWASSSISTNVAEVEGAWMWFG